MKLKINSNKLKCIILSFLLLVLLPIQPLSAADISIALSLQQKDNFFLLSIKNQGNSPAQIEKILQIINKKDSAIPAGFVLGSNEEKIIPLPVENPSIPGSYNLSARVYYLNEGKMLSLVVNQIFDFNGSYRIDRQARAKIDRIVVDGQMKIEMDDENIIPLITPFLPEEVSLIDREIKNREVIFKIRNTLTGFNNSYLVYFIYEMDAIENGKTIHRAGYFSDRLSISASTTADASGKEGKTMLIYIIAIILMIFVIGFLFFKSYKYLYKQKDSRKGMLLLYVAIILVGSYFTYFHNYHYPNSAFWDENYHIASAQKYVDGVMYMEPHPPLAKMLIALGEVIINPNSSQNTAGFLSTDYITSFPAGYNFMGMRFFPTLFAMLCVIPLFFIFFLISRNANYSLLFSSFYLFENAFIVHSRAAMLDGIQMFFILCGLLYSVYLQQKEKKATILSYFLLGLIISLSIGVKINGTILLLLLVFLFFFDFQKEFVLLVKLKPLDQIKKSKSKKDASNPGLIDRISLFAKRLQLNGSLLKNMGLKIVAGTFGVLLPLFIIFYMHFSIGSRVVDNRYYKASDQYKEIIANKQTSNLLNFAVMMKDNYKYMSEYAPGVPRLDYCKQGENGSLPIGWPIGHRSINYRWAKSDGKTNYTYLQGNPVIWFSALLGVFLALMLVSGRLFFGLTIKSAHYFKYIILFLILYVAYMAGIFRIDRVMYLYHYFIALMFAIILFFLVFNYIFEEFIVKNDRMMLVATIAFVLMVFYTYVFFSPLTYSVPMTNSEFLSRMWFDFWGLKYVGY